MYYGPEYISHHLKDWANHQGIELIFIQPGHPEQNAYIERFNRTVRYDWLSHYIYRDIEDNGYGFITMRDPIWD